MNTKRLSAGLGLAFLTLVFAGPVAAEEDGRAWLGVRVRPMTETLAEETGYAGEGGVYLQGVVPDGPAADAGLRAGDVLFRAGRQRLSGFEMLLEVISDQRPGTVIELALWREGKGMEIEVRLAVMPDHLARAHELRELFGRIARERQEVADQVERLMTEVAELTEALIEAAGDGNAKRAKEIVAELLELAMETGGRRQVAEELEVELAEIEEGMAELEREGADRRREAAGEEGEYRLTYIGDMMRIVMKALIEADREDLAEHLERRIHAERMRVSGRKDAEAKEIMAASPTNEDLVEILELAAKLHDEKGREDDAGTCRSLAKMLPTETRRENRDEARRREMEKAARQAEEAEQERHRERRIREIEEQMERIRRAMGQLEEQLRHLRREKR